MRDYGTISPKYWQAGTGKALRGDAHAQVLSLYLMTSPHSNMIGLYHCPLTYMVTDTGIPFEGASEALRRLVQEDFCCFDEATDEVFVVRMAAYQIAERLEPRDNRCKSVARELALVTSALLQQRFRAMYSVAFHLGDGPAAPVENQGGPKSLASPSEPPSKPRAGAGAGTGARTGAGARASGAAQAAAPPPPPPDEKFPPGEGGIPADFKIFIESERPELDAVATFANFADYYPEHKRSYALWRKWVRREMAPAGARPSPGKAAAAAPITVPGRPGRDPVLAQIEADAKRATPPPPSVRALRDKLARPKDAAP